MLAAAPELTPESARMLLETAPGASVDVVARASLLEATYGFSRLRPDELRDLGAIFATAYARLTVDDRGRLESYLQRVRAGDPGTGAEEARARRAFNMAINALTTADRQRLQALYERAIAASLAAKRTTTRLAAEPVQMLVATPEPAMTLRSPPTTAALPRSAASAVPSPDASDSEPDALTQQGKRGRAKQRDDIEDAARREGIPPGWLR